MPIATKYNTPQAKYLRDRLARRLEGKTEPPPDPGNYDPVSGSDAQGAEPLPGETTEEYNARQARLREAARERLRAKFGNGGMGGMGSSGPEEKSGLDNMGAAMGDAAGAAKGAGLAAAGAVGSVVSGGLGFLKSNVIENTELHSKVKSSTAGA